MFLCFSALRPSDSLGLKFRFGSLRIFTLKTFVLFLVNLVIFYCSFLFLYLKRLLSSRIHFWLYSCSLFFLLSLRLYLQHVSSYHVYHLSVILWRNSRANCGSLLPPAGSDHRLHPEHLISQCSWFSSVHHVYYMLTYYYNYKLL